MLFSYHMTIPAKLLLLFPNNTCFFFYFARSNYVHNQCCWYNIILLSKEFQLERQGSFSSSHFSNPIKKRAFCCWKVAFLELNTLYSETIRYDVCDTERTNDNDKKSGKLNIIIFFGRRQ